MVLSTFGHEASMSALCSTVDELDDFLAFVLVYAPDRFRPRHNLDLTKAFEEIDVGLQSCASQIGDKQRLAQLMALAEQSLAAYERGDDKGGAFLLQDMAQLLKK
jgi:hypothetical protein